MGLCKGLVGERFKRRGVRWSVAGANAVLALRAAVFNDRYDDFWQPPTTTFRNMPLKVSQK